MMMRIVRFLFALLRRGPHRRSWMAVLSPAFVPQLPPAPPLPRALPAALPVLSALTGVDDDDGSDVGFETPTLTNLVVQRRIDGLVRLTRYPEPVIRKQQEEARRMRIIFTAGKSFQRAHSDDFDGLVRALTPIRQALLARYPHHCIEVQVDLNGPSYVVTEDESLNPQEILAWIRAGWSWSDDHQEAAHG